jgi:hypothetical protein
MKAICLMRLHHKVGDVERTLCAEGMRRLLATRRGAAEALDSWALIITYYRTDTVEQHTVHLLTKQ